MMFDLGIVRVRRFRWTIEGVAYRGWRLYLRDRPELGLSHNIMTLATHIGAVPTEYA